MPTPKTKVSFKEQMHQAREDAILQATCRLLGEKSFDVMTMDDVANAVGIAKASLYKHFASKEDLCCAAMVQILGRVRAYLDTLPAEMPPQDKLQDLVRWSLERLITNEMPLLPSRNSSLRAVLMASKQYLDHGGAAQVFLAGEVFVKAGLGDAHGIGDIVHRHRVERLFTQQAAGGLQDGVFARLVHLFLEGNLGFRRLHAAILYAPVQKKTLAVALQPHRLFLQ